MFSLETTMFGKIVSENKEAVECEAIRSALHRTHIEMNGKRSLIGLNGKRKSRWSFYCDYFNAALSGDFCKIKEIVK
jgi:hypothetical protein